MLPLLVKRAVIRAGAIVWFCYCVAGLYLMWLSAQLGGEPLLVFAISAFLAGGALASVGVFFLMEWGRRLAVGSSIWLSLAVLAGHYYPYPTFIKWDTATLLPILAPAAVAFILSMIAVRVHFKAVKPVP